MKKTTLIALCLIFCAASLSAEMYVSAGLASGLSYARSELDLGIFGKYDSTIGHLGYGGINNQFGFIGKMGIGAGLNVSYVMIGEYTATLTSGSDTDSTRTTMTDWNTLMSMGSFSILFVYAPLWNNTMFLKLGIGPSFSFTQVYDEFSDEVYNSRYFGVTTTVDFALLLTRIFYLNFGLSVSYNYLNYDDDWEINEFYIAGFDLYPSIGAGLLF